MNFYEIEILPPNIYAENIFCSLLVGKHHLKDSSYYVQKCHDCLYYWNNNPPKYNNK